MPYDPKNKDADLDALLDPRNHGKRSYVECVPDLIREVKSLRQRVRDLEYEAATNAAARMVYQFG